MMYFTIIRLMFGHCPLPEVYVILTASEDLNVMLFSGNFPLSLRSYSHVFLYNSYHVILDLITLIITVKSADYRASHCAFSQSHVTYSLPDLNILVTTVFSNRSVCCFPLRVMDQVSYTHKTVLKFMKIGAIRHIAPCRLV
jgi:hypothetical protein